MSLISCAAPPAKHLPGGHDPQPGPERSPGVKKAVQRKGMLSRALRVQDRSVLEAERAALGTPGALRQALERYLEGGS